MSATLQTPHAGAAALGKVSSFLRQFGAFAGFTAVAFAWLLADAVTGYDASAWAFARRPSAGRERALLREELRAQLVGAERFLRGRKDQASGITPDFRDTPYITEVMRLNVTPQLLGYLELHRATGSRDALAEATDRGRYLLDHLPQVLRGRAFDGMAAYALIELGIRSGDSVYSEAGLNIADRLLQLERHEIHLNRGLMAVMGWAQAHRVNPDDRWLSAIDRALLDVSAEQNPDGSFAHDYGGTDLHYSAWIAMQLLLIRRSLGHDSEFDARLARILVPLRAFLAGRVSFEASDDFAAGEPRTEERQCEKPAPDHEPVCRTTYYYGAKTAWKAEYDSRGWSNEPAYHTLAHVSRFASVDYPRARLALGFLTSIAKDGAWADKWRHPVDEKLNPEQAPFGNQSPSVIRTSVVFWTLAVALNELEAPAR
jgi:hypothetical protein